ncbi:sugar transporter [Novosphingobium colocasiae]|uniref:Uncharacterized protein n=1 Tax=Novosphingobium colocasiae TaxID=1256513 RepID=A0A918PB68_9SPHN|nr:sugar transporter [Novosphingobium colocasiae]GGY95597.1 hypothetical protein GCM10011614_07890 [Novosphingobium colocasiae]
MDLAELAKTDPVSAQAFAAMPGWVWGAYGLALGAGTLGAIALLLGRRVAVPLFVVSLAAEIAQFGWTFLGFGLIARKGASTGIFPLVIVAITAASLAYARARALDGTLRR